MTGLVLEEAEIVAVTKKVRPTAQLRVLRTLGIDARPRPDGSLLVLRKSLQPGAANAKVKPFEIDWGE